MMTTFTAELLHEITDVTADHPEASWHVLLCALARQRCRSPKELLRIAPYELTIAVRGLELPPRKARFPPAGRLRIAVSDPVGDTT